MITAAYNRKRVYSHSFYTKVPSTLNIVCWWVIGAASITMLLVAWANFVLVIFLLLCLPLLGLAVGAISKAILNMLNRKKQLAYNADLHRDATWLQTIILPRHAIDLTYNEAVNLLIGEVVGLNGPKNIRFQGFLSFKESLLDGRLMYTNTIQEAPVISSTAN